MNPARVRALAAKEFVQILRDYRSLWLALAIPVLLLFLFGTALTLDVDRVPTAVWDRAGTPESRELVRGFAASPYFHIVEHAGGYPRIDALIDKNRILAALVVPGDFSRKLLAGDAASVQLLLDGSDSNTALIARGYAEGVCAAYNRALAQRAPDRAGQAAVLPVELRPRVWFNETLLSRNFIIPGLIAVIMMIIAALLTSLTVAREWDRGTMEQLISTPVSAGELIAGKFIPYFCIGMADVLVAVLMGEFVFHVPLRGSLVLLFLLSGLFLAGVLCWGILISILTRNQFIACQVAFITTFLPAFLLSGFAFPIANMPKPVELVTYLVPARYFVAILKGIYLKGAGLGTLWPQVLPLAAFAVLTALAAGKRFRKAVD